MKTGGVVALVKFNDYDSEDSEEVDVRLLQKIATVLVKNRDISEVGGGSGRYCAQSSVSV